MELPSCLEDYEPDLVLSVEDRRELIKGLAEDGKVAIGKYITSHTDDQRSGIAKLMQRLRSKLDAQVKSARERIERKFRKKTKEVRHEMDEYLEPFPAEGASQEALKQQVDSSIDTRLIDVLAHDDALKIIINLEEEPMETKPGWWARLRDAFWRALSYLIELFRRFVRWIKGASSEKGAEPDARPHKLASILLNYPSGSEVNSMLERKLDNALSSSPAFNRAISRELRASPGMSGAKRRSGKTQPAFHKHLDKDRYKDAVRTELHRRIKRVIKREQRRLAHELERKRRRVKQLRQDKAHQELRKREAESRLKQLEKQKAAQLDKLKHEHRKRIHRSVQKALVGELEDAGYVHKDNKNEIQITSRLIDRFAEIVLSDELQKLPTKYSLRAGTLGITHGIYEKKRLQTSAEVSRMDIVASMVNARQAHPSTRHIYESDIITHKDMRSTISHVILIFDKSGSMEENDRIKAAKKAVLALYKAVKNRNPRNIVDFIAFDSTVKVMDILSAWRSGPSGFTNTGEALSTALQLIKNSRADYKLVYLITDGLPEAYTDPITGRPRAGDLEKSLRVAVNEAKKFRDAARLKLTIILLEPKENLYTDAAKTIAKAAGGDVIVTEPGALATELLTDYIEV